MAVAAVVAAVKQELPMCYSAFFDEARKITVYDPLAEFLGAAENGVIEYSYADAVKLAGHSCPTVAGAYLMTLKALARLYGDKLPQRGCIQVEFCNTLQSGVTGVIANVVSLITGATSDSGFKGIAGRFDRRDLLFFDVAMDDEIRFQRTDTGASVAVSYHSDIVVSNPAVMRLMQKILSGAAEDQEKREFAKLWQERVRQILESIDDPRLVTFGAAV
ncbi:MAG: FmdE family protein [Burkholderiaceae bacterium]